MDNRKNNKGVKGNKGNTTSKSDGQKLIEKLSPMEPLAFKALGDGLKEGRDWAVKLFFQYNYGMPKQIIEQTNITPITEIVLTDATATITNTNT